MSWTTMMVEAGAVATGAGAAERAPPAQASHARGGAITCREWGRRW